MPALKMDQATRINIMNTLIGNKASIYPEIKRGDTINFTYMFNKIKISGKGIIVKMEGGVTPNIKVLSKKDNLVIKLFYADETLVVKKLSSCSFRTRRANLNYLIHQHVKNN